MCGAQSNTPFFLVKKAVGGLVKRVKQSAPLCFLRGGVFFFFGKNGRETRNNRHPNYDRGAPTYLESEYDIRPIFGSEYRRICHIRIRM